MNALIHIAAFVCPLILCWGFLTVQLWVADWDPYWNDYGVLAAKAILVILLTAAAVLLGGFALLSTMLPLWVLP